MAKINKGKMLHHTAISKMCFALTHGKIPLDLIRIKNFPAIFWYVFTVFRLVFP